MTKNVRVENADNSAYKVRVRLMQKHEDATDEVIATYLLPNPTDVTNIAIYDGVYLIVDELPMS